MVGHVYASDGSPISGVRIQSVEAEVRTDDKGHFAVEWKVPDTHVFFIHEGLTWARALQPDDPKEVELRLPELGAVDLRCAPELCAAKLAWELGPGFGASVLQRCQPGAVVTLPTVPAGVPSVECRRDGRVEPMEIIEVEGQLALVPPQRSVRIDVQSTEGAAPEACSVTVDHAEAADAGDGFWTAQARGAALIAVTCEGRASWPTTIGAGEGSISVDWSRTGPTLDLEGAAPEAAQLRISPESSDVWLTVDPDANGVFALPPMGAGTYRARIALPDSAADAAAEWPVDTKPGALVLARRDSELLGVLVLESDLATGRVGVQLP